MRKKSLMFAVLKTPGRMYNKKKTHASYRECVNDTSNCHGLGGCEVVWPPRKPKFEGSIPAEIDRFSRCENRRHRCHRKMWHGKDILYQFGSGTLGKIESWQYLASDESLNLQRPYSST
ncbi:hypothetical protein TNCV_427491 [Trichonephila clavipes]|nr:hypothetical protein TNCV_427491 [Trichonephila clavipes]